MQYRVSIPNERSLQAEDFTVQTKVREKWRDSKIYQHVASIVLIPFVIIAFWQGSWDLMDHYRNFFTPIPSLIVSGSVCLILELIRNTFISKHLKILDSDNNAVILKKNLLLSIYDLAFNLSNVGYWRALWGDDSPHWEPAVAVSLICLVPLVFMRAMRNLVAPPIVIITDSKEFVFNFPTRYRIDGTREPGLYVLDCLFSVLVIGSLVVFVWRGLWVLLDLKLYPHDIKSSSWASLIVGYVIVGVTFSLQPFMKWACGELGGFWRILVADVFLFVSFIGTVNVWRGIWNLLDCYFLPDNKLLSNWITHGVSLLLLILLNCSNSVLVRGVYIDAEEPEGQCVVFPVYYIRLFFQKERAKKQKRLSKNAKENAAIKTETVAELPLINHIDEEQPEKRDSNVSKENFSLLQLNSEKINGEKIEGKCEENC